MRVVVSRRARRHVRQIARYNAEQGSPDAALAIAEALDRAMASLAEFPERFERASPEYGQDLRRMVVRKVWLVFYRVLADRVQVVAVRDGRRAPGDVERSA